MYGRTLIQNVDPGALLLLQGDDAVGITGYLQLVRGVRPDVLIVTANFLGNEGFDERLLRRHPQLRAPQYGPLRARAADYRPVAVAIAAFLNANADAGRPLFCEQFVPAELIRPDYMLIPAGAVWKLEPQGTAMDVRYWKFPVEPEQIAGVRRRARGQRGKLTPTTCEVEPERYEERLIHLVVMARYHLSMGLTEKGEFLAAGRLCESILALDPKYRDTPEIVHHYGISMFAAGEVAKAEPALRRSVEINPQPRNRATAACYLAVIARKRGDAAGAERWFRQSLDTPGLDEVTRREIEARR
jgi:tetratricopeptide (TPR) repeat protein